MLIPTSDFYEKQEAFPNKDFEKEEGIYKKYKAKEKKSKKKNLMIVKKKERRKK